MTTPIKRGTAKRLGIHHPRTWRPGREARYRELNPPAELMACPADHIDSTMVDQIFRVTGGVPGYHNPGHRIVVSTAILKALSDEGPIDHRLLGRYAVDAIRILDYPIRLDETVTEMRLEPV